MDDYDWNIMSDAYDKAKAELATLRAEVDELKRIVVGQFGVITELRIKLAGDAIKSFAGELTNDR